MRPFRKHRVDSCLRIGFLFGMTLLLSACAPKREYVKFDNPYSHPLPGQSSPIGEYDSYELIDRGAPNSGIPPMYSQRNHAPYGVLVDGPRHYPYLSPQYRTLDLPYPMPPGQQIINQTDAPIIVRDGHPDRNNQIIMRAFD